MARFKADEVDNYGGQGGRGYFSLKNDGDVAKIRFLYTDIDDVEGLSVHTIQLGDKKRYVNCLRKYNDPVDVCPFCREKKFTTAKLFIPVYNIDEDKVQVWERGKKFFGKMSSLCSRYPNIVSHIFEIERNGKPGDTSTTYEPYEVGQDDTEIDDFEVPEVIGTVVLDKSAEEMEYFLDNGDFPSDEDSDSPRRRNSNSNGDTSRRREDNSSHRQQSSRRRTPARRSQNDEDTF